MTQTVDKAWFISRLEDQRLSVRGLAREMGIEASAVSRMFSGQRKMQMDEAKQIAHFLRVPVAEVMRHAGVSVDLDGMPTRIMLAAAIDQSGQLERMKEPRPLPQSIIEKVQAAISRTGNGPIIAAQIRATTGPLAIWDDAVVLFKPTEIVEHDAIGTLAICRTRDGAKQLLVRLTRARKTGEATIQRTTGEASEVLLDTAAPVIAVIP
jgi:transcriptional regulator with XRE-family HTH domain